MVEHLQHVFDLILTPTPTQFDNGITSRTQTLHDPVAYGTLYISVFCCMTDGFLKMNNIIIFNFKYKLDSWYLYTQHCTSWCSHRRRWPHFQHKREQNINKVTFLNADQNCQSQIHLYLNFMIPVLPLLIYEIKLMLF